jgi:hypothetical protein
MRRVASLCSVAVLMALTLATPAHAQRPTRESMPLPDRIRLPNVCSDFTIVADILVNREYGITFTDANGDPIRTITQGSLKVRLTNPENGESIVRNISGPGELVFHADGSSTQTSRGAWFLFFFEGQLGTGMTGTGFVNHGQVVFVNNADGTATILSRTGTFEDVCVTLG